MANRIQINKKAFTLKNKVRCVSRGVTSCFFKMKKNTQKKCQLFVQRKIPLEKFGRRTDTRPSDEI